MRTRLVYLAILLVISINGLATVEADAGGDTESQATTISTGITYSYVCWDDACSYGVDRYDYHKFYVYYGDKAYLKFENTCDIDYTEADVKIKTYSSWSQEYRLQCDEAVTWDYNIQKIKTRNGQLFHKTVLPFMHVGHNSINTTVN